MPPSLACFNVAVSLDFIGIMTHICLVVLPFVSISTAVEILTLDPLSSSPNPGNVGGTEWKRATDIASDIFERCPGIAFARNMTAHAPGWKCNYSIHWIMVFLNCSVC